MASPTITFRTTDKQKHALEVLAELSGKSVSQIMSEQVADVLEGVDVEYLEKQLTVAREVQDRAIAAATRRSRTVNR